MRRFSARSSVLFTPSLTTSDICTSKLLFNVPLRQTAAGLRPHSMGIRYRAYPDATPHGSDGDRLRLRCLP
jgi:hypothetical protein